jgi:hypothetical protein
MQKKLTKFRTVVLSAAASLVIHLPGLALDRQLVWIAHRLGLGPLIVQISATFIVGCVLFGILQSELGVRLYRIWLEASRTRSYRERDQRHYERDLQTCIRDSKFLFCILLSGQTLQRGRERFVQTALENLPNGHKKDIRLLLLQCESPFWRQRAQVLSLNDSAFKPQDYLRDSEKTAAAFRAAKALVAFYEAPPGWRMYLFDNRVFLSRYNTPPQNEMTVVFYRDDPMYEWLYREFRERGPREWREPEEAKRCAKEAVLNPEHIRQRAYELHFSPAGVNKSENDNWFTAERHLRSEMEQELCRRLLPDRAPYPPERPENRPSLH